MNRKNKARFGALNALRRHDAGVMQFGLVGRSNARRLAGVVCVAFAVAFFATPQVFAQQNWDGDNAAGNFSYNDNWYGNSQPTWATNQNLNFNYRNNAGQTSLYYDYGGWVNTADIFFATTFGGAVTWDGNGNGINFNQRLENDSSYKITLGTMKLSGGKFGASQIELNPVNADMEFLSTFNLYNDNNKNYATYGNNSKLLTIGMALGGGSGVSYSIEQYSKVYFTAAQTFGSSAAFNIKQGELWLGGSGSLASGMVVNLGQSDANTAKFYLNSADDSHNIKVDNSGGTKVLGSLRSSGTDTFSGNVTNNGGVLLENTSTGSVGFSGTISGSGAVTIGSSTSASGTVILGGANTFSGNLSLVGGTLSITNANSLGTGIVIMGSGAVQSTMLVNSNTTITNQFAIQNASTNSALSIASGQTVTFSGNLTQTNGSTNTTKFGKDGAGTLVFAGASSTYGGQIQIGHGTVIAGTANSIGTNVTTAARGVDLGLNVGDVTTTNNVALLLSNGVTFRQSIYVAANSNSATRTLGLSGSGTAAFTNEIYLDGTITTDAAASSTLTFSGVLKKNDAGGGGGLVKTGAGTVTLSGVNTYTGTTWVNQGVLRATTSANALGATNGSLVLNGGNLELANDGNLAFLKNTILSNNASITIDRLTSASGSAFRLGTLTMAGAQTLTLVRGALNSGTSVPTLSFDTVSLGASGAVFVAPTNTGLYFTNGITGTDRSFSVTNDGTVIISNTIATGSGSLIKGGGGILNLKSSNSLSGGITVNAGRLLIADNNSLGTGVLTLGALGGSEVGLSAETTATTNAQNNTMVWNSNLRFGAEGGTGSFHLGTGAVTLATNVSFSVADAGRQLTVGGAISGAFSLTKTGAQTLTLSGANTYSGGTIVTGGTLALSGAGSLLSTGSIAVTNANFDISGISASSTTVGSLAGASTGSVNLGSKTLVVGDSSNTTFSGVISNTGSIVKQGAGTLTLGGNNTYSGTTTISAGTLQVGASSGTGTANGMVGTGDIINNGRLAMWRSNSVAVTNVISGTGILRQSGAGTLVLTASNSYAGGTEIANGTVVMSNNNALGSGAVTLGSATSDRINSLALANGVTNNNTIQVVQGTANSHWRALDVLTAGDTATQIGTVTLSNATDSRAALVLRPVTNSTLVFGAGINVLNNTNTNNWFGRLMVAGGGTVVVTNAGNVTTNGQFLQVRVADGTLVIGSGSLNARTNTASNQGIDLGVNSDGLGSATGASLYASNGVVVRESLFVTNANGVGARTMGVIGSGTATFAGGEISLRNVGLNLFADTGGTAIISNRIINNASTTTTNSLTKIGAGTVVLATATNTFSGAINVSEGTLRVTGVITNTNPVTAFVTVTNTGVLSGSGRIATGTTTIADGGTISPGNSPGTIFLSNAVFGTNGNYNWQLYDAAGVAGATNGYDWISATGGLNITANATDKFNINLWTLSGLGPDTNGSAINFDSAGSYQWTLGTWALGITNWSADYFRITTAATNGTGGFLNAFSGTFTLTSSNNSIFLNYAGAAGIPIYSAASGTWSTNFTPALYQGATNWIFDGATGGNATNDIASVTVNTLGTLTFSNTAGSYTLSAASGSAGYDAASALAITGNIVNNSANAQTVNLALGFSNAATINAAAGHLTFGGAISNGTSLTFTGASNNTVSGAISGLGYLVKDGAGTLVLSGNNTYTGGTLVSTGTLQVGAGGTSGSLSTSALTNNATLAYNRSDNLTASYDISGTGALIKTGAGTLTLSGNNSYGGTTTISNGAISISVLANAGSNSGIGTNATVTFAGANATNTVLDYTGGNVTTDRTFAFNGTAASGEGGTIAMASSNTVITATGAASGTGKMILSEGTLVLSNTTTPNSFAPAAIQVDTGATLQLAANNQIGNTTGLILNGGTFRTGTSSTGFSDTLGTLTLSASSTIDLGAWTTGLRTLTFADSSAITWTGTLTITNWQGVAHQSSTVAEILFGTGGLTSTQLGQIVFANQGITGGELIGGGGELVPIPEPRVYAAAVALLAAVGWRERKRVRALLGKRKE